MCILHLYETFSYIITKKSGSYVMYQNPNYNCNCNRMPSRTASGRPQNHFSCADFSDSNFPPAMAYVAWQYFDKIYEPPKALCQGTMFPELDLPFTGKRGNCP